MSSKLMTSLWYSTVFVVFINTELLSFTVENSVDLDSENRSLISRLTSRRERLGPVKSIIITATVPSDEFAFFRYAVRDKHKLKSVHSCHEMQHKIDHTHNTHLRLSTLYF